MARIKRVKNIPRQDPTDVQADAAASRLGERHRINPLKIFDWARGCGVDLSDLETEEKLFQIETPVFDYLLDSGECQGRK